MPLRKNNTTVATRCLYAGISKRVCVLKRRDDQHEGTVTSYVLYNCRRSMATKTGEALQGDMFSNHRTTWHIPARELQRVGIRYLNALDRIVEDDRDYWQPEGTTLITEKLFGNEIDLECLRVDPPGDQSLPP